MKKMLLLVVLLALPVVYAQLDWAITDFRCGNKVLNQFELCEKDVNVTFCDALGTLLEIDTVCDTAHCTCLPRVNKAFCGNNIREGVEVCDGTGDDKCADFGKVANLTLTCNPKTCGCNINQTVPVDYNPVVVEQFVNQSSASADCGNKKVERDEDCDPPNALCTTILNSPGICDEKCKCVSPEMLGVPEPEVNVSVENVSADNVTENVTVNVTENVTENATKKNEEPGFFAKLWQWIVALFS